MLSSTTRQGYLVMTGVLSVFCLAVLIAFSCIFISSPASKAVYHYNSAQALKQSYSSFSEARTDEGPFKPDLLHLTEHALLRSLSYNPYNVAAWKELSEIAQRNKKMTLANKALRFSHQFSSNREVNDTPVITLASNDVSHRFD